MARITRLTILLLIGLASTSSVAAAVDLNRQQTPSPLEGSGTLPPQGIYEGCAPGATLDACVERLVEIRAAGFRYVLNYSSWYGSPAQVMHYADAAESLGLQLIWPLNNSAWRGEKSLSENYSTFSEHRAMSNSEFTSFAIDFIKDRPVTWGFYIGDELPADELAQVSALSAEVRALAPEKKQLYVARPGTSSLKPFLDFPDVAGVDVYPVGPIDPVVWRTARRTSEIMSGTGVETAMVLQAFSWSQYQPAIPATFPTRRQMQVMRDAALRCSDPAMILWYSYQDIQRSDSPQGHWDDLTQAAFSPVTSTGCVTRESISVEAS